jgi:hypothetical protein
MTRKIKYLCLCLACTNGTKTKIRHENELIKIKKTNELDQ